MGTYLEQGGNVSDTAHVYSDWVPGEKAYSERVIGDWLARSSKRCQIVLITKGGHPDMTRSTPDLHKSRMTHKDMKEDLDGSLKQLRADYIDLYFYHRDNGNQSVEEEIEVMEEFVKAGKIRYYGCSNWDADQMKAADDTLGYIRGDPGILLLPAFSLCSFVWLVQSGACDRCLQNVGDTIYGRRLQEAVRGVKQTFRKIFTKMSTKKTYKNKKKCVKLYKEKKICGT